MALMMALILKIKYFSKIAMCHKPIYINSFKDFIFIKI